MLNQESSVASGQVVAGGLPGRGGTARWRELAAEADDWERQHEAEWVRVDEKLRGLAARRAALDAEEARGQFSVLGDKA